MVNVDDTISPSWAEDRECGANIRVRASVKACVRDAAGHGRQRRAASRRLESSWCALSPGWLNLTR